MRLRHAALLVPLAAVGFAAACKEDAHYLYTGQRWNADQACLEDYKPIEYVPGDSVAGACAARCFTVNDDTFISTLCGGLPFNASDGDPKTSPCKEALAAAAKSLSCSSIDASAADDAGDDGGDDDASAPPDDAPSGG